MIVFLDSGILGLISSPNERAEVTACQNWLLGLLAKGVYVVSSDICDYEVRRSLLLLETQQLSKVKNIDADMIIVAQWLLLSNKYPARRITI